MTDDQDALRAAVRELIDKEAPQETVKKWDEDGHYPQHFFEQLASLGYYGLPFPEEYGGDGRGVTEMLIVSEELGRRGLDFAAGYGITMYLALNILRNGTPAQKKHHLSRAIRGEERYTICMTEPGAGSDAAGIRTSAQQRDGAWVLNGQKLYITGAGLPGTILHVTARTDPEAGRHSGLSVFLVPADAPGVEVRRLKTLGRHLLGTNEVFFDDVRVGPEQMLGPVNRGWDVLHSGLEFERVFTCGGYIGALNTVFEMTRSYVNAREQFNRSIGSFQAVAHPIADMYCDLQAAKLLTYKAASIIDSGESALTEVTAAKLFGSEALQRATNTGMQLMGGAGFMLEYDMQRYWREARVATVTAGSSQIMRTILARAVGVSK
ncbi:acyl-CoA dehydrogenase family protein [Streptomyces sp. NPDC048430]|uniref:acyl-CoA dehydrogenase family protein n=1 Tax=unclassified Streptomyces TaxID=2593676 RepID=UPI0034457B33